MTKIQKECSKDTLKKKMYTKYISKGIALSLMNYNPNSKLFKAYKNTSYCAETIILSGGKTRSSYCKNRWCQTCNRIKTFLMINGYAPQIDKLIQPVFVTLTLPTCKGNKLKDRISEMEKAWRSIYDKSKKAKYKRTYAIFKGVRKGEITIRPNGYYHYHFHFIIEGWAQGEWLISEWLKRFPEANKRGQDLRFVDEFGKFEIFKYAIKSEVKTDNRNAKRYDLVFNILRGKRTFSTFGGLRKIKEEFEDEDLKGQIIDKEDGVYKWWKVDWWNLDTGEPLVDLPIPEKVKRMVAYPDEKN
ncbi:protein rep [Tenacibaculum finnmarkense]|uniref:protein rep n=2 Tax=Tenacibaculum finnmarkense TaxID=2781243 RepID=UPI00187BBE26|nr:protein rep [Tenacibaculum finnmarkense]MBE7698668.1 protein rep [Tenacibaculum finnmarkense genomovar ulcerans]